jgi:hypothetical protein
MAPLPDVIREINAIELAHVRMATTQDEPTQRVLRILLVDVFPQPWLDNSGEYLAEWSTTDELNDYGRAVFFTGFAPGKVAGTWLANQQECTLRNFDPGVGQQSRMLTFRIPELQTHANSERIFSHSFDGYPEMPWPHMLYVFEMKAPTQQSSADFERLIAPGQRLYANFPVAREKIVHGVSDPNRSHQFSDKVGVRVVDASGWLKEVRVASAHVAVQVLGTALQGSRVILTGCPEFDDVERAVNRPAQYCLPIPRVPSQFEIALVRGHSELDRAVYTAHPNQFSKIQKHVVMETMDEESKRTIAARQPAPATQSRTSLEADKQASATTTATPQPASAGKTPRASSRKLSSPSKHGPIVLRVVVASPSDVRRERDCLPRVLEELNHGLGGQLGVKLDLWRWETDTSPGFHAAGPQGRIDDAMHIEDSDIVIGIFWKRFGTPVEDANSGTEHELRRAIKAWQATGRPHIMVYFNRRASYPSGTAEIDQWRGVLSFKESFPHEGLWWAYQGSPQFERLVRQHLQQDLREKFGRTK